MATWTGGNNATGQLFQKRSKRKGVGIGVDTACREPGGGTRGTEQEEGDVEKGWGEKVYSAYTQTGRKTISTTVRRKKKNVEEILDHTGEEMWLLNFRQTTHADKSRDIGKLRATLDR